MVWRVSHTTYDQSMPPAMAEQAKLAVKDHYTFDFLVGRLGCKAQLFPTTNKCWALQPNLPRSLGAGMQISWRADGRRDGHADVRSRGRIFPSR